MPPDASHPARGYALILLAAALWATLGVIYHFLALNAALPPLTIAGLRAALGGLLLFFGLLVVRPSALRVERRSLGTLVLYGLLGIAAFYAVYVQAILMVGMAVAAVLLYTAPAWVAVIAWRFLGERLTRVHLVALGLTLVGCALVAEVYRASALRVNGLGITFGLLSGFTYGLWSVFNKVGTRRANPWTFQCYGMLIGAAALLVWQPMPKLLPLVQNPQVAPWLLLLALGPTVGASVAYAAGVRHVPVSVASLIATLEPPLAAALAYVVLGETLEPGQLAGGALILWAVWLLRPRSQPPQP